MQKAASVEDRQDKLNLREQPQVLSFDQALEILPGFTKWSLYNMVRRKQIPHRKRGRKVIFLRSELDEWVKNLPGVTLNDVLKNSAAGP